MKRKEIFRTISACAKVFARGAIRTAFGAATAGLAGLAVYGFLMISGESGWTAVCEFIVATCTMAVALISMYAMGADRKRGSR